jgi:HEPN domain-containing protein
VSIKIPTEWFDQAEYDIETAKCLLDGRRYIYAVFMCHLALEKALKGLYTAKYDAVPPKSHNLLFFLEKINCDFEKNISDFVYNINELSIPTRYPEVLREMAKKYTGESAAEMFKNSKEVLLCCKKELQKLQNISEDNLKNPESGSAN